MPAVSRLSHHILLGGAQPAKPRGQRPQATEPGQQGHRRKRGARGASCPANAGDPACAPQPAALLPPAPPPGTTPTPHQWTSLATLPPLPGPLLSEGLPGSNRTAHYRSSENKPLSAPSTHGSSDPMAGPPFKPSCRVGGSALSWQPQAQGSCVVTCGTQGLGLPRHPTARVTLPPNAACPNCAPAHPQDGFSALRLLRPPPPALTTSNPPASPAKDQEPGYVHLRERGGQPPSALREALQAAVHPAGANSPSGVVSLSQSQASTMRVKERCGHREGPVSSSPAGTLRGSPLHAARPPLGPATKVPTTTHPALAPPGLGAHRTGPCLGHGLAGFLPEGYCPGEARRLPTLGTPISQPLQAGFFAPAAACRHPTPLSPGSAVPHIPAPGSSPRAACHIQSHPQPLDTQARSSLGDPPLVPYPVPSTPTLPLGLSTHGSIPLPGMLPADGPPPWVCMPPTGPSPLPTPEHITDPARGSGLLLGSQRGSGETRPAGRPGWALSPAALSPVHKPTQLHHAARSQDLLWPTISATFKALLTPLLQGPEREPTHLKPRGKARPPPRSPGHQTQSSLSPVRVKGPSGHTGFQTRPSSRDGAGLAAGRGSVAPGLLPAERKYQCAGIATPAAGLAARPHYWQGGEDKRSPPSTRLPPSLTPDRRASLPPRPLLPTRAENTSSGFKGGGGLLLPAPGPGARFPAPSGGGAAAADPLKPPPSRESGAGRRKAASPRPIPAGCQEPGGGAPPEVTAVVPSYRCAAAALLAVPKEMPPPAQIRARPHAGQARPGTRACPALLRDPLPL
ncbi:basic proline-rich protein-like [Monodon monoceros]|uniref:basic proline-rich protein-like n=1 Tax=Monodon monoceros TaxID=40151 RepID=UPI0010F5DB5A|nr:basic proline-rich protein-like [Monodon monoceros]